ncbi:hypothetical protein QE152_g13075 [Popillia japonica]|uniref:Uncharacterized protein n=1 Tax=Popillia japonica TaxID=7064 RepID=A0AAW1LFN3_POPJA
MLNVSVELSEEDVFEVVLRYRSTNKCRKDKMKTKKNKLNRIWKEKKYKYNVVSKGQEMVISDLYTHNLRNLIDGVDSLITSEIS